MDNKNKSNEDLWENDCHQEYRRCLDVNTLSFKQQTRSVIQKIFEYKLFLPVEDCYEQYRKCVKSFRTPYLELPKS